MHQPADIDRQLMGFRPRQQHAVAQRMQKPRFADPFLLVDDDPVHDRDLPGRTAETERGHAQPDAEGFSERDAVLWRRRCAARCGERGVRHGSRIPDTGGRRSLLDGVKQNCRPSISAHSSRRETGAELGRNPSGGESACPRWLLQVARLCRAGKSGAALLIHVLPANQPHPL